MSILETPWKIEEKIFGWLIIVFELVVQNSPYIDQNTCNGQSVC